MKKSWLIDFLFIIHFPIVLVYFGLFFVPTAVWADRAIFHFWYFVLVMSIELIWGILIYPYTKRIDIVCPLTTLMQYLRGFAVSDERNYDHSYISELFSRFGIKIAYKYVSYSLFLAGVLIAINYWKLF